MLLIYSAELAANCRQDVRFRRAWKTSCHQLSYAGINAAPFLGGESAPEHLLVAPSACQEMPENTPCLRVDGMDAEAEGQEVVNRGETEMMGFPLTPPG